MTDTIKIDQALQIMREAGYDDSSLDKLRSFHEADRTVLIFENQDMGHPALGHRFAMPWDEEEIPPHGPDTEATGLGWRYLTKFIVRPEPNPIQEV